MDSVAQGDVYWIDLGIPFGSEPGYRRPVVVIQNDPINRSALRTVLACAMTTNPRREGVPGNVSIDPSESGLPSKSVVNVSHVMTIDRARLVDYAGSLSRARMRQIVAGLTRVVTPRD